MIYSIFNRSSLELMIATAINLKDSVSMLMNYFRKYVVAKLKTSKTLLSQDIHEGQGKNNNNCYHLMKRCYSVYCMVTNRF